ncbi:MAG: glycerophosphodiester phosphodiesterase family protein [Alistipes sp.]|nr:glycerophosphodiester phosphodiesterase family protein [Alistipes sp.]
MKIFKHLLATAVVAVMLASCAGGNAVRDDKRAAKIVAEIRNPKSKNVLVISHRGDWRNYPENSIPAIESVIKMGVDIVELDVALTSDSVLVLQHDRTIDRCTTGKGKISDITYDSIQKCYLKTAHNTRSSLDLKVPTLREALEVCKDRIVVNIDKGYEHYDMVLAIAEELGVTEQILIKGNKSLANVRKKMAGNKQNLLYMPIITPSNAKSLALFEEYEADSEPQLAYEICWNKMIPEVEDCMKRVVADGSKLWVNSLWNSLCGGLSDDVAYDTSAEEVYGKLVDMGATMIQTDRPEFLLNYLRSRGLHD